MRAPALTVDFFEPATLSIPELLFLRDHLGESPTVALSDDLPPGVNPIEVEKHLTRFVQLEELAAHKGRTWEGLEVIADSITRYLAWHEKTAAIKKAGGPRHPSQFTWDDTGMIYRGGIGSDSDMVRSEITDEGELVPFRVALGGTSKSLKDASGMMPWLGIKSEKEHKLDTIETNTDDGVMTCSICRHVVTWKTQRGRGAYNLARGKMAQHLTTAKKDIKRHRSLYHRAFKQ